MNIKTPFFYTAVVKRIAHRFTCVITSFIFTTISALAQDDFIVRANEAVDGHQNRIDLIDGTKDGVVSLLSVNQTNHATQLYIYKINRIQKNINNDNNLKPLDKKRLLTDLSKLLEGINRGNYFMYNTPDIHAEMILKLQEVVDQKRILTILKSDVVTALHVIPFYDYKPYASEILKHAAHIQPSLLLTKFSDMAFQGYANDVLEEVCKYAPMHVSFYMGTNNPVYQVMMADKGHKTISTMMEIFQSVGSNSRAYMLIDPISKYKMTVNEAHDLALDRDSLFKFLLKLRDSKQILGSYSVDDELTYTSLRMVREINNLHDESDKIRFRICDSLAMSSSELYAIMVYGEDEIYTSTFLGLFNRFMTRMSIKSSYEFLHSVGMNRYRTFVKMCAGYNTLPLFLTKMSEWEKRSLFNRLIQSLQSELDPLEEAVAVADTYGSLKTDEDKQILALALKKEYETLRWTNKEAEKLYAILMSVLGIDVQAVSMVEEINSVSTLTQSSLFKNNEHVQQHFFFDDDDGNASFASFVERFSRPGWTLLDKGSYVIMQSTAGKKVKIYANKPATEMLGQEALKALFKKNGRYPDIVVHRGHSYYASATIATITPNAELVILGSCGGYNNINGVLNFAPDAQIISSKQVGTMAVNNEMIFEICENLRMGKDLQWELVWTQIAKRIKTDKLATERFQDYLPPHKNLGAIMIKAYRRSL